MRVSGLGQLPRDATGRPAGGWICVGLPHRTWVEPVLLVAHLPASPRLAMMADAGTVSRSAWRRRLVGLVGGVLPVGRDAPSRGLAAHAAAVAEAIDAGAVFSLFPEIGPPARPPALRRVSVAPAYLALRTGAPLVPVVFGGTDELFLGRRIEMRVLPPIYAPRSVPPPGSNAERLAARRLHAELLARVTPAAAAAHSAAQPSASTRRRWRWLSGPYPRAD